MKVISRLIYIIVLLAVTANCQDIPLEIQFYNLNNKVNLLINALPELVDSKLNIKFGILEQNITNCCSSVLT